MEKKNGENVFKLTHLISPSKGFKRFIFTQYGFWNLKLANFSHGPLFLVYVDMQRYAKYKGTHLVSEKKDDQTDTLCETLPCGKSWKFWGNKI